nr:Chain B, APC membrane recruitment protein 1 [Homo sapiens]
LTGCGDIIAEQ